MQRRDRNNRSSNNTRQPNRKRNRRIAAAATAAAAEAATELKSSRQPQQQQRVPVLHTIFIYASVCLCENARERERGTSSPGSPEAASQPLMRRQNEPQTGNWEWERVSAVPKWFLLHTTCGRQSGKEREKRRERGRLIRHAHFALHFQRVPCCCQAPLRSLVIRNRIIILRQLYGKVV